MDEIETQKSCVEEICLELGYLPLAINLIAAQLYRGQFEKNPEIALKVLRQKRLDYLDRYSGDSLAPEDNIRISFKVSYERLTQRQKHVIQTIATLLPTGANFASILFMSKLSEHDLQYDLNELNWRSLVSSPWEKRYHLHPLLWEYVREKIDSQSQKDFFYTRAKELIQNLLEKHDDETDNIDVDFYEQHWSQAAFLTAMVQPNIEDFLALADATSNFLFQTSRFWEGIRYNDWVLGLARSWNNSYAEVVCLDKMGSAYQNLGFYEKALSCHKDALKIAQDHELSELQGIVLGNLGNDYQYLNNYKKAFENHKKSASIAKEIKDRKGEGAAIGNQAIALRSLGQPEEAFKLSRESLDIAREIGDSRAELSALSNYANAVASLEGEVAAQPIYKEALQIAEELHNRSMQASLLRSIGRIDQDMGNYENALSYFENSLNIARDIDNPPLIAQTLGSMGEIFLSLGDLQKAQDCHEKALEAAKDLGDLKLEGIQLDCLGSVYLALEKYDDALHYYREALSLFEKVNYFRGMSAAKGNIGHVYYNKEDYQNAQENYFLSLEISIANQDRENIGLTLVDIGNIFCAVDNLRHAVMFWVAACPILAQERKSYFEEIVHRLSNLRNDWEEFNEFLNSLIHETGDELIESIREMGLLENITEEYTKGLLEEG